MNTLIAKEIKSLSRMTVGELGHKYFEVFGEPTRSRNKPFLRKRIAWRIQANAFGNLSSRAKRRAEDLANDADIRIRPPSESTGEIAKKLKFTTVNKKPAQSRDPRLPQVGTVLVKTYKGQDIAVKVLDVGFEFEERFYKSLSAIAKEVTGAQCNGFMFFGLNKKIESSKVAK